MNKELQPHLMKHNLFGQYKNWCPVAPVLGMGLLFLVSPQVFSQETNFGASLVIDSSYFSVAGQSDHNATRGLLDLSYEYSSNNLTFFVNGQAQRGDNGSEFIGDIQAFSNIDEADFEKLYEVWLEYSLDQSGTRIKLGQIDMNGEFAFADNAGEFINSSMGFSPTVFVLPTYPDPAIGGVIAQRVSEHSELAFGFNAGADTDDFDDIFYMAEWRYSSDSHTVKLGGWYHDGQFEQLSDGTFTDGAEGFYAVAEGQLLSTDWGYYFQFGIADEDVSEISRHLGFGAITENTGMENVMAGFGVSAVWLSDWLMTQDSAEVAWEAFLRYDIDDNFAIKPDIQYIASPSGESRNEFVATLRLEMAY